MYVCVSLLYQDMSKMILPIIELSMPTGITFLQSVFVSRLNSKYKK